MPSSAFTKFNKFSEDLAKGVHVVGTHVYKAYLSNTAPNVATHSVKADLAEIAAGNGYAAGGVDIQVTFSRTGAISSMVAVDKTITAAGGSIGPFRYAVIYNDTPSSPADPLVGYYDYGSAITLGDGEPFVLDFGTELATIGG